MRSAWFAKLCYLYVDFCLTYFVPGYNGFAAQQNLRRIDGTLRQWFLIARKKLLICYKNPFRS
jgi:hypothetical protein